MKPGRGKALREVRSRRCPLGKRPSAGVDEGVCTERMGASNGHERLHSVFPLSDDANSEEQRVEWMEDAVMVGVVMRARRLPPSAYQHEAETD